MRSAFHGLLVLVLLVLGGCVASAPASRESVPVEISAPHKDVLHGVTAYRSGIGGGVSGWIANVTTTHREHLRHVMVTFLAADGQEIESHAVEVRFDSERRSGAERGRFELILRYWPEYTASVRVAAGVGNPPDGPRH